MGWWGHDVFDGDATLDLVIRLEETLGYHHDDVTADKAVDLAHVAAIADPAPIAERLVDLGLAEAVGRIDRYEEPYLATQVVARVAMDLGVPLGDFAQQARLAALLDPWAITDDDRAAAMLRLAADIDRYQPRR